MRAVCEDLTVSAWESARFDLGASHLHHGLLYAWPARTGPPHGYHHPVLGTRFFPRGWDPSVVPLWDFIVLVSLHRESLARFRSEFHTRLLSINISILYTRKEPRDGVELSWWQQSQQLLLRVEARNSHHVEDRYKILLTWLFFMIASSDPFSEAFDSMMAFVNLQDYAVVRWRKRVWCGVKWMQIVLKIGVVAGFHARKRNAVLKNVTARARFALLR